MGNSFLSTMFRWPEFDLSSLGINMSLLISSWSEFRFSSFAPTWRTPTAFQWPEITFSVVIDDILWTFVVVLESVALVSMLCFFFVFCGCHI